MSGVGPLRPGRASFPEGPGARLPQLRIPLLSPPSAAPQPQPPSAGPVHLYRDREDLAGPPSPRALCPGKEDLHPSAGGMIGKIPEDF